MAFNFPASPTVGQIFTPAAGVTYIWSGTSWDRQGSAGGAASMPAGVVVPFAGSIPPAGTLLCDGKPISRVSYPTLFAAIGTTYGAGDGTTTFNLPDMRSRVPFGRDDMGSVAANRLTVAIAGFDAKILGASGGDQRIGNHTHQGSGTTSGESAVHAHTFSGTTGYVSADHAHYVGGATDAQGAHAHTYDRYSAQGAGTQTAGTNQARNPVATATSVDGAHAHNISLWTGGISANHTHAYSGTTAAQNANHTHTYNFTTDNGSGGGVAQNVPPAIVLNYIIFTGA